MSPLPLLCSWRRSWWQLIFRHLAGPPFLPHIWHLYTPLPSHAPTTSPVCQSSFGRGWWELGSSSVLCKHARSVCFEISSLYKEDKLLNKAKKIRDQGCSGCFVVPVFSGWFPDFKQQCNIPFSVIYCTYLAKIPWKEICSLMVAAISFSAKSMEFYSVLQEYSGCVWSETDAGRNCLQHGSCSSKCLLYIKKKNLMATVWI